MLNQHSRIAAPHPPHVLQTFMPLLAKYGDLSIESNFMLLVTDVCDFVMLNPVSWGIDYHAQKIASNIKSRSLVGIYQSIYEHYATKEGKSYWCSKSMANLHFIPHIELEGIRPIYIHLIRDGRDVAVSFRNAIVGEKHCYHIAKQWKNDQETAEKNCRIYAIDRYIPLMYESLIHDPENTLKILLHHLGLSYEANMMQYSQTTEAQKTAEAGKMWDNVRKPVMSQNSNKFLTQLTKQDILIFESIAGDTLENNGYTPYFTRDKWINVFTDSEISAFNSENDLLKSEAIKNLDPNGVKKRLAQDNLVKEIKSRPNR